MGVSGETSAPTAGRCPGACASSRPEAGESPPPTYAPSRWARCPPPTPAWPADLATLLVDCATGDVGRLLEAAVAAGPHGAGAGLLAAAKSGTAAAWLGAMPEVGGGRNGGCAAAPKSSGCSGSDISPTQRNAFTAPVLLAAA